jgi:hypothetical protein
MAWGSLEERYRLLCMKLLCARYAYYVLANEMMTDAEYDRLEDGLKTFEQKMPQLAHPKSPTKVPGSDIASDYPQSVRWYCENRLEGGSKHSRLACGGYADVDLETFVS